MEAIDKLRIMVNWLDNQSELLNSCFNSIKGLEKAYDYAIDNNLEFIDNDYTCSTQSHRGIESEAVQALVNKKELPIQAIKGDHYINPRLKNYSLIIIEGQGLNYINQIN